MAENTRNESDLLGASASGEPKHEPLLDELDEGAGPLYIARVDKWIGSILLNDGTRQDITLLGEILVAAKPLQNQHLVVERIQRVAIRSQPLPETLGGAILIAGPANKINVSPGLAGYIKEFEVKIYYPALSKLAPACIESDAIYPYLEVLRGTLTWEPEDSIDGITPQIRFALTLNQLIESYADKIRGISARSQVFAFQPPTDEKYIPSPNNTLQTCQITPPSGTNHHVRELQLRFFAVNITNDSALENDTNNWIADACEVWCQKGGIVLVPQPAILSVNSIPQTPGQTDPDYIEIFLVDDPNIGGGLTNECGTNYAYILLDVTSARSNRYLLAHELGHVLGLYHPEECTSCAQYRQGSPNSVMVPGNPISPLNTLNNLMVIEQGASNVLVGNAFITLPNLCGWTPDHLILDPLFQYIWNYDHALAASFDDNNSGTQLYANGDTVFQNNSPNTKNPQRGSTNHLCIRLWDCQLPTKPLSVYLYLVSETAPHQNLILLPVLNPASLPIVFPSQAMETPSDTRKRRTRSVQWQVPSGYPDDCWVFAVGITNEGPSAAITASGVINNPTRLNFNDLQLLSQTDPNVMRQPFQILPPLTPTIPV